MRESQIEARLVRGVKALGGKAYKFTSPGNNGMPDRLISLPGDHVVFVETKAPGETPRALQNFQHDELVSRGHKVFRCVDNIAAVDEVLRYCKQVSQNAEEVLPHEI